MTEGLDDPAFGGRRHFPRAREEVVDDDQAAPRGKACRGGREERGRGGEVNERLDGKRKVEDGQSGRAA